MKNFTKAERAEFDRYCRDYRVQELAGMAIDAERSLAKKKAEIAKLRKLLRELLDRGLVPPDWAKKINTALRVAPLWRPQ